MVETKLAVPVKEVKEPVAPVTLVKVPTSIRSGMSGISVPPNLSTNVDVGRIQSILRSSERGEPWQYYALCRDMELGYPHLQAEWSKRKAVVIGQQQTVVPHDINSPEDVKAALAVEEMIDGCDNWSDGIKHLLDATLYPSSTAEKIYEEMSNTSATLGYTVPIRYRLKQLAPVNYTLYCYRIPYTASQNASNPVLEFNPNDWEPWMRFFSVEPKNGAVNWATSEVYKPEKDRHIIHRGNFLSTTIPDSYGGQMRAILFWWLLATQGRDWMAMYMQKYGSPFLVGKVDANNTDSVAMLNEAFQMSQQVGGIVVDSKAAIEVVQAAASDGANAHKTLIDLCNREVSKIIIGQELSSTAKNTGMGSGVSELQGEVRDDFRSADTTKLADTLRRQLFMPYLQLNGLTGRAPHIFWGGFRAQQGLQFAQTLASLNTAGVRLTDNGLRHVNDKYGVEFEKFNALEEAAKFAPKDKPTSTKDSNN